MLTIITFAALLLLASGYACWRGGAPERWVAALMLAAFCASVLTPLGQRYTYTRLNVPLFTVDVSLLIGLILIALVADRFWPMWLAALQLVAIGAHGVRLYDPEIVPGAYWWMTSKAAYPMVALLVIGTARHRIRLRLGMPEFAWSFQRWRHAHDGRADT